MRAIADSFVAVFRRMCMEKCLCFAFLLLSLAACGHQDNKEGQRVRKGQVLFIIDQAIFRAEEKAAKAQLQQAEAQLESARSNLSYTVLTSPSDGVAWTLSGEGQN